MQLKKIQHKLFDKSLSALPNGKILINTMNAYSFCVLQKDEEFQDAINSSHFILPDGISIVWAIRFLTKIKLKKIAGADLFAWEMARLQEIKGKCFFLGSSEGTLHKIIDRAKNEFPDVQIQYYAPPFKPNFNQAENNAMVDIINSYIPDVLFIGMTAPKQEKWAAMHFESLKAMHVCSIGAVFDFYAMTKKRAPKWIIRIGFEWFYRFLIEPQRTWKRYLVGNFLFVFLILKEKFNIVSTSLS